MWTKAKSLITDDFLSSEDLALFRTLAENWESPPPKMRHMLRTGASDTIDIEQYCHKYKPKLLEIYKELTGQVGSRYNASLCWTLTGQGYEHKPHVDASHKMLSTVVYIYPDNETGTYYDEDESVGWHSPQAEWKVNRAFSFSATPDVTWHRFRSISEKRVTLNFHLTIQPTDPRKMKDQFRKSYT